MTPEERFKQIQAHLAAAARIDARVEALLRRLQQRLQAARMETGTCFKDLAARFAETAQLIDRLPSRGLEKG